MSDYQNNPFQAPLTSTATPTINPLTGNLNLASNWRRFFNFLIDTYLVQFIIGIGIGVMFVMIYGPGDEATAAAGGIPGFLISAFANIFYYFIFEVTTGRTLGKLMTGTKVVNAQGGTPTAMQILGRTFARIIPFEPFSFLFRPSNGWHDSLSGTHVVRA